MEVAEISACFSEGTSDSEVHLLDTDDDDDDVDVDYNYATCHIPKLQFRKDVSTACWNSELGMAEIQVLRGQMWKTMGIVRNRKIYCSIEETLFLAERGALSLYDANHSSLSLNDIYAKVSHPKNGCRWESFQVYKHMRSLGYIIRRHGIAWTLKMTGDSFLAASNLNNDKECEHESSIAALFSEMQMNEWRPVFDVYIPNSKFKKSSPGNPTFLLCIIRGHPPSILEFEELQRKCNGIPLKLCRFDHGRVSFFSFDKVDLPFLP